MQVVVLGLFFPEWQSWHHEEIPADVSLDGGKRFAGLKSPQLEQRQYGTPSMGWGCFLGRPLGIEQILLLDRVGQVLCSLLEVRLLELDANEPTTILNRHIPFRPDAGIR